MIGSTRGRLVVGWTSANGQSQSVDLPLAGTGFAGEHALTAIYSATLTLGAGHETNVNGVYNQRSNTLDATKIRWLGRPYITTRDRHSRGGEDKALRFQYKGHAPWGHRDA